MTTCEYAFDKVAYSLWQSEQIEIISTTEEMKRSFYHLVKRAINNELSETDKVIFNLYFERGYSQQRIAGLFDVNVSTINRRINKSLNVLYEKLKYAAEYRFGVVFVKKVQNNELRKSIGYSYSNRQ